MKRITSQISFVFLAIPFILEQFMEQMVLMPMNYLKPMALQLAQAL